MGLERFSQISERFSAAKVALFAELRVGRVGVDWFPREFDDSRHSFDFLP
jgi:hypothetical protein